MAAKVAVVAVPTVLGVASIRVYTVKEKPTEGLLPRERLNIYTPLPQSAQAQVVPERSGIIQSGITTAREGIQPFAQASKNAYVSVKTGTSKLYHTLGDVYYYLKDPPPEFLPRFGTITMAGLLGMFLARKGSRFKRTVVPLGLMSAAASVCYPAQAVAVVKVTGKKVYAAGQWSSAAVASLFASKPQEPVTKDPTSPQPQAEELPIVESAEDQSTKDTLAQSPTCPQTEAALNESVPVSDQPVIAVISEEVSSVTPAEIPPSQTPSDTVASIEEPSDTKQVSSQPDVSTPSIEPKTLEAAQIEAVQAEDAPAEVTSVDSEPSVPVISADPPHEATAEEIGAPQQPAAEHHRADGSGFKADPALMDFGQSSPEDEDLYSTRS
eukprot:XP_011609157.1 PREDICTED: MICOS complex subunit MIC27 isoform X1 [Takifugu rubripes]